MVRANVAAKTRQGNPTNNPRWLILGLIIVVTLLVTAAPLLAESRLVVDQAGLFSASEASALAGQAQSLGEAYGLELVIVTTDDAEGKSARVYADDFYDQNGYGVGADKSGILFLLDLDNREAYISTAGSGIRYLTDQRIEEILDAVFASGLTDGDYVAASQAFLTATQDFLAQGIPTDQFTVEEQGPNTLTAPEGLAGLAVSGVSGLGFALLNKRRYKGFPRPGIFDYHRNSLVSMGIVADNLVNSRVTSRPLPKPQSTGGPGSGSGRSTVHRSGGGSFHGGGGRKF
ncbi:MAG: TPM domain-containing protein [Clostridia bacterium]|nr:TPM domain-containing protein [Clostridia bacterium]